MNVFDVFQNPTISLLEPHTEETWRELLRRRMETTKGFLALEERQGFISYPADYSSSRGQEMLRLILFRVLEECAESYMSSDPNHIKEEAIDALNYLLTSMMLDPTLFPGDQLSKSLQEVSNFVFGEVPLYTPGPLGKPLVLADLGRFTANLGGRLADTFRNRAWMEHTQHPYFEGHSEFKAVIQDLVGRLLGCFDSWDDFCRFYLAKDEVLQFRLSTRY